MDIGLAYTFESGVVAFGEADLAAVAVPEVYARALAADLAPLAELCRARGVRLAPHALKEHGLDNAAAARRFLAAGARATPEALEEAAARGNLDVVRALVEHGDAGGVQYALDAAATRGHVDVVRYLLDKSEESASRLHGDALEKHRGAVRRACENAFLDAARRGHHAVLPLLAPHVSGDAFRHALTEAATDERVDDVRAILALLADAAPESHAARARPAAVARALAEVRLLIAEVTFEDRREFKDVDIDHLKTIKTLLEKYK